MISMRVTSSLRSAGITPRQHYYGGVRPSLPHRYFRPRVVALAPFPLPSASWFPQFRLEACAQLTPPVRRPPPIQYCRLPMDLSQERMTPLVLTALKPLSTRLRRLAFARLLDTHLPRVMPGLLIRRSPPRLLAEAARTGLRPVPEHRSRGAHPHLLRSCTARPQFMQNSFRASAAQSLQTAVPAPYWHCALTKWQRDRPTEPSQGTLLDVNLSRRTLTDRTHKAIAAIADYRLFSIGMGPRAITV